MDKGEPVILDDGKQYAALVELNELLRLIRNVRTWRHLFYVALAGNVVQCVAVLLGS